MEYISTNEFIKQITEGKYPCVVLENDDEEIEFEKITENFKEITSQENHYDYLFAKQQGG